VKTLTKRPLSEEWCKKELTGGEKCIEYAPQRRTEALKTVVNTAS
jgi:hypothetical protein